MAAYELISKRPKTMFVDLDGVIFRQKDRWPDIDKIDPLKDLLPGVREKFLEWEVKGYRLIITTGRADSYRRITEEQLLRARIPYHLLVMAAGMGQRVLINNLKTEEAHIKTAVAINLEMDEGLVGLGDMLDGTLGAEA